MWFVQSNIVAACGSDAALYVQVFSANVNPKWIGFVFVVCGASEPAVWTNLTEMRLVS